MARGIEINRLHDPGIQFKSRLSFDNGKLLRVVTIGFQPFTESNVILQCAQLFGSFASEYRNHRWGSSTAIRINIVCIVATEESIIRAYIQAELCFPAFGIYGIDSSTDGAFFRRLVEDRSEASTPYSLVTSQFPEVIRRCITPLLS